MARLTAAERNALPDSAFAGPDRSYPINDPSHARNALARASQHAGPKGGSFAKLPAKKKPMGAKMKRAVDTGMVSQEALSKRGY